MVLSCSWALGFVACLAIPPRAALLRAETLTTQDCQLRVGFMV